MAVATEDKDFTASDGTVVNIGNEVIDELKENKKIGWVFLDAADEAVEGVNIGKYYAAVVIGSNFTESMYNVFKQDFKNTTITYYENEKKNAVATKITDTAFSTLKQSINEKFIEVVTSAIFEKTNSLTTALSSLVFTLFVYSLTVAFGNIGEAIAVVIMVIQVAGAGGTFPIEVLPKVYQYIYKYLPFPYGMNAMRETIGGMYGMEYIKCLGVLGIYILISLFIGLVVAVPFEKLNKKIEKSKEQTDLMI